MFQIREAVTKSEIVEAARSFGADLAGVVSTSRLEKLAPPDSAPSTIASSMKTMAVFAKRSLRGVAWSRHLPTKQLAGGRTLRVLDHAGSRLASFLEVRGYPSLPVPTGVFDFERRIPEDVTPAGQGSYLLRLAAVEAGLGTWGLNMMVLTPRFGPRVYLGAVMTELEVEDDRPLPGELCLGLEKCGRCAAICPEDAIPRRAPAGADLAAIRGLDRAACCRSSQPYGFRAFVDHLAGLIESQDTEQMWRQMRERRPAEAWIQMAIMKEGAIAGCSECTQVCPVGEDYDAIQKSPHRRQDLPGDVRRHYGEGFVWIDHTGPSVRRNPTWNYDPKKR